MIETAENDIEKIANDASYAQIMAHVLAELERERQKNLKFGACPHCKSAEIKKTRVANVFRCSTCRTYYGENYQFVFPEWARGKKQFFRRAFCLHFNIQGA